MITLCLWNWNWEQEYALGLGGMKSQTWYWLVSATLLNSKVWSVYLVCNWLFSSGVVGSGRELLTVEAQFVAELGLLACVEVREGMDFSVDSPQEATKGLWNGYSWQGQQFFCSSVVCSWCTSDLRSSTLDF